MLLTVSLTRCGEGRTIVEKLARRLDMPCCDAATPGGVERAAVCSAVGPCILLAGPEDLVAAGTVGHVQVLLHRGDWDGTPCNRPECYDLAVNTAPLGTEGTVELLSQFVALKLMAFRGRSPGGRYA